MKNALFSLALLLTFTTCTEDDNGPQWREICFTEQATTIQPEDPTAQAYKALEDEWKVRRPAADANTTNTAYNQLTGLRWTDDNFLAIQYRNTPTGAVIGLNDPTGIEDVGQVGYGFPFSTHFNVIEQGVIGVTIITPGGTEYREYSFQSNPTLARQMPYVYRNNIEGEVCFERKTINKQIE